MSAPPEPSERDGPFRRSLRAFRSRNFTILWIGNLLSNTGSWMQQVAEPWLVLRLSGSPVLLGLDSFAGDAPVWFLILVGGVLADRRDRRKIALFFQTLQFACPALILALLFAGQIRVWHIVVASFVVGITDALSMPAIAALVPSSVPKQDVPGALAINSAQFNASRMLGPLVAGVVMSTAGVTACFALNAASYVPFLLAIFLVRLPIATTTAEGPRAADATLGEALRTVGRDRSLRRALLKVVATSLFCAPLVTFVPVLIRDAFRLGSTEFGGALSMFGVGGLVGAAMVLQLRDAKGRHAFASAAAMTLGATTIVVALDRSYAALLALLFVAGGAMVASNTAANSILQGEIDARLRGRVASLYTLALRGGAPLGNLATGLVVARSGVRFALAVNGVLALVGHAIILAMGVRRARAHAPPSAP